MSDGTSLRMVRGGTCRIDLLMRSALVYFADHGCAALSVFAADLPDVELVQAASSALPQAVYGSAGSTASSTPASRSRRQADRCTTPCGSPMSPSRRCGSSLSASSLR